MAEFVYSLTRDDYIGFEKFKLKRNKTSFFSYLMCLFFIATGVYDAVVYKNLNMIIISAVTVISLCVLTLYSLKAAPEKRVKKLLSLDSAYLCQNKALINDKSIEIRNIPQENQAGTVAVYPYSIMSAIYETEEYFYFFIATEVKILPKRDIPAELFDYIKKVIAQNSNYLFIK